MEEVTETASRQRQRETLMGWTMRKVTEVVAPLVVTPVAPFEPRLPPLPEADMPSRGQVFVRDHFRAATKNGVYDDDDNDDTTEEAGARDTRQLRVVSLNMEMGKQMGAVLAELVRLQPDVVLLQEVDLCCPRTGNVDCAGEIAQELGMACVFASEVERPRRFPGEARVFDAGGRQGNAILSRFPVKVAWPVRLTCRNPNRWHQAYKTHTEAAAILETPHGDLLCYSAHFDPHYAGVEGRIAQYFELLDDVCRHYAPQHRREDEDEDEAVVTSPTKEREEEPASTSEETHKAPYALIGGDFNTVITGVLRLAPTLGWTKSSWWTTLGWTEAEWFDKYGVEQGNADRHLDFSDPFDKQCDITMEALTVMHKEVGPPRSCSDHCWISVDVIMEPGN